MIETRELTQKFCRLEESIPPDPVIDFLSDLLNAEGQFILLENKTSRLDEQFWMSVRYGQSAGSPNQYLLIDIAALQKEGLQLIARRDWEIEGQTAKGNYALHSFLPAVNPVQNMNLPHHHDSLMTRNGIEVSSEYFLHLGLRGKVPGSHNYLEEIYRINKLSNRQQEIGYKYIYRGDGLGSLMTAVSLYLLYFCDVETLTSTTLSPEAKKLWRKFGRGSKKEMRDLGSPMPILGQGRFVEVDVAVPKKLPALLKRNYPVEVVNSFTNQSA